MLLPLKGVCASQLELEIKDGIITKLAVFGGCDGNHKGISQLAIGQNATDVADRLEGIRCGMKSTSCPDQIAKAIRSYRE